VEQFRIQPSTAEQRQSIYEDLQEILTVGFLSHSVSVSGVPVALRSLNPSDLYLMRHRAGPRTSTHTWNSWFLAHGVWMIGGQIILEDPSAAFEVYEMCSRLPKAAMSELMHLMSQLLLRSNKAVEMVESFCYENESRFLWRSYGHAILERSGVPGVERLGWSTIHRLWASFNTNEDVREEWMSRWTHTKLLASTQAPKGIKKLNSADEQALENENRRRQSIHDKAYYKVTKGIDLDIPQGGDGRYQDIRMAVTTQELEEEMRRVRAGEKDKHDQVVDFYKRRVRERIEKERADQRKRVARIEREMAAAGVNEPALRPMLMSGEDVAQQLARKHSTRVIYGNQANELYDRYLKDEPILGTVAVPKGGMPTAMPAEKAEQLGRTLQEQVAARKPTFGGNG